jgi:hypothetical protein
MSYVGNYITNLLNVKKLLIIKVLDDEYFIFLVYNLYFKYM